MVNAGNVAVAAATALSGLSAQFALMNRDGTSDHTTYYNDQLASRIPSWVKETPYKETIYSNNKQVSGAWDTKHSIINLGNGVAGTTTKTVGTGSGARTITGDSTAAAADLIAKVRAAKGNKKTPYKNPNDNNDYAWDHIRNFWYRDGDLFALMLDDNACDMMGGGKNTGDQKQTDVVTHIQNNVLEYEVRQEDHHMEYLRDYCEVMGGTLWAPGSQAEYVDLMERKDGICAKHGQVYEDGKAYGHNGWDKIEIYLNLHREGYLQCPSGNQSQGKNVTCPTSKSGYGATTCNGDCQEKRDLKNTAGGAHADAFYTTDYYFGNAKQICEPRSHTLFKYSDFRAASDIHTNTQCKQAGGGEPFIAQSCWNQAPERFQQFIEQDIYVINKILAQNGGTVQRQKDCVVAICNDGPPSHPDTGITGDKRRKSEWNMDHCNQQRHVGICRMKMTGCNKPSYLCDNTQTTSCGQRAVYTQSYQDFLNADISAALTAVKDQGGMTTAQVSGITSPSSLDKTSTAGEKKVIFAGTETVANIQTWATSKKITFNEVLAGSRPADVTDDCKCECAAAAVNDFNTFSTAQGVGTTKITDNSAIITHVAPTATVLGTKADWTCSDTPQCWSGNAKAECKMDANAYESKWIWSGSTPRNGALCDNSCCPKYVPHASMKVITGKVDNNKNGDTITVQCKNTANHIKGDTTTNKKTITAKFTSSGASCFEAVECVTPDCKQCPSLANGYCYDSADMKSAKTSWAPGAKMRCRCNKCFVMKQASGMPWFERTCQPEWSNNLGECVALQCANPHPLMHSGKVVGWPKTDKAGCGGKIEYDCADGYEAEGGVAPSSECSNKDPTATVGEFGTQGFFSAIVGKCVPKTCKMADLKKQDGAWDAVILPSGIPKDKCHATTTYNTNTTVQAHVAALAATTVPEGTEVVYECYDDYSAHQLKDFRKLAYDVVEDLACAAGSKVESDSCRTLETDKLVETYNKGTTVTIATTNDKLVARCVNGAWKMPTHKCVCDDEPQTLSIKYFEAVCPAEAAAAVAAAGPSKPSSACPAYVTTLATGMIPMAFYALF